MGLFIYLKNCEILKDDNIIEFNKYFYTTLEKPLNYKFCRITVSLSGRRHATVSSFRVEKFVLYKLLQLPTIIEIPK